MPYKKIFERGKKKKLIHTDAFIDTQILNFRLEILS
jgi:hypothetical protein